MKPPVKIGLTLLGGCAVLALLHPKARAAITALPTHLANIPAKMRAKAVMPLVKQIAAQHGIPERIMIAWILQESGFKLDEYNPEKGAMVKWAREIVEDRRYSTNPDYNNAVEVNRILSADPSKAADIARRSTRSIPYRDRAWKWGSFGIMQVSYASARAGGFPYGASNTDLFDPILNLELGAKEIDRWRRSLYGSRKDLSDAEWSRVRTAYVGGAGLFKKNPQLAQSIGDKFAIRLATV